MSELALTRGAVDYRINLNPFIIDASNATVIEKEMNAYGEEVDENSPSAFSGSIECRIVKQNSIVPEKNGDGTPFVMQDTYYLIARYSADVPEGLIFTYTNNKKFRTKIQEKVIIGGEVAYIRCELVDITPAEVYA